MCFHIEGNILSESACQVSCPQSDGISNIYYQAGYVVCGSGGGSMIGPVDIYKNILQIRYHWIYPANVDILRSSVYIGNCHRARRGVLGLIKYFKTPDTTDFLDKEPGKSKLRAAIRFILERKK